MNEYTWVKQDRMLMKGDILRVQDRNGVYHYAVCTGTGFGCAPFTSGNAIYVNWPRENDLNFVIEHKDENPPEGALFNDENTARWERYWGIKVLQQEA